MRSTQFTDSLCISIGWHCCHLLRQIHIEMNSINLSLSPFFFKNVITLRASQQKSTHFASDWIRYGQNGNDQIDMDYFNHAKCAVASLLNGILDFYFC